MKITNLVVLLAIMVALLALVYNKGMSDGQKIKQPEQAGVVEPLRLKPKPVEGGSYRLLVKVTAYCPCELCCGSNSDGKTATGRDAYLPGVASDPTVIPLGSRIDIPGYTRGPNNNGSWILVDDTGSAIKGNHIDVRFRTHSEALRWAARHGPKLRIRVWRR